MRSIGARLTLLYALSATLSLAILFGVGYELLEGRLTHGLDELNYAGFRQVKARLGADYRGVNSALLDQRVRETSEFSSALFYIEIENPKNGVHFYSGNLKGRAIPDIKGKRAYDAMIPGIGQTRVNEFLMPPFDVTIATPTRALRESMRAYVRVCAALLAAMILVSTAVGFGLSRLILRPLRSISETAKRISSDNLNERIPVSDVRDEISDLGRLLNLMFARLEAAFDQVRRFSDEASHELKTPLSLIRLHAEKMLGDGDLSSAQTEAVLVQIEELARLNQIIDELLFLSRAQARAIAFDMTPQTPQRLLDSFSQDAAALTDHYGRRFELRHSGRGLVAFEEKWIRQVLLNLLTNALNVSPPGGLIVLDSALDADRWRVSVEDEGPGLSEEQRGRIFDRFVRFNVPPDKDRGSGLGLAICKSIIELHGGAIWAEPGRGGRGLKVVFETPGRSRSTGPARINQTEAPLAARPPFSGVASPRKTSIA